MDRRSFLQGVAGGLMLGNELACAKPKEPKETEKSQNQKSRVAVVRNDRVRKGTDLIPGEVNNLLHKSIQLSLGSSSAVTGLEKLLTPHDRVGIKLNCLAGIPLSPTRELVQGLTKLLNQVGVDSDRILYFERAERDLRQGGFPIVHAPPGPLFLGNDSPGCGYEKQPTISGQVGSCLSRIVTERISILINVGVLKDHNLAGVGGAMKNLFGVIHNPNKYHDHGCHPYVADVLAFPVLQAKIRLHILDGLTAQCHGGPGFLPEFAWPYNGLLVSQDPVALDRVAWDILEKKRKQKKLPSLAQQNRAPRWLQKAADDGLGKADWNAIQIHTG